MKKQLQPKTVACEVCKHEFPVGRAFDHLDSEPIDISEAFDLPVGRLWWIMNHCKAGSCAVLAVEWREKWIRKNLKRKE